MVLRATESKAGIFVMLQLHVYVLYNLVICQNKSKSSQQFTFPAIEQYVGASWTKEPRISCVFADKTACVNAALHLLENDPVHELATWAI